MLKKYLVIFAIIIVMVTIIGIWLNNLIKKTNINVNTNKEINRYLDEILEGKQKYTSNLIDAQNGKTAFIELESKGELKIEEHDSYYTYVDPFKNSYNIKKIENVVVSENGIIGKGNLAALFKVTVTYIDNNNITATMELAIVLLANHEIQNMGTYDNYTGSTDFVKSFTDLYEE